jgi:hypothetical protein
VVKLYIVLCPPAVIRAAVPKGEHWSWQADLDVIDAYADVEVGNEDEG